jgi:hypothetical protein
MAAGVGLDGAVLVRPLSRCVEQAPTVTDFVQRALAFYATHGITAKRLQTDNHFSYAKNRSLRELLAREGIHHRFIPPRTPKRNGKVARYQQTVAREWYGQALPLLRRASGRPIALADPLQHPQDHSGIGNRPPISRVRKEPRQNS